MYVGAEIATGHEMCFIGQAIEFLCRLKKRGEKVRIYICWKEANRSRSIKSTSYARSIRGSKKSRMAARRSGSSCARKSGVDAQHRKMCEK